MGVANELRPATAVLLPHTSASVAEARRLARADLEANRIRGNVRDDALLVLSELLTNAVRHARPLPGGQVRAQWTVRPDAVDVAVSDGGGTSRPQLLPPRPFRPNGRGLAIVQDLASTWDVDSDAGVVTVSARIPLPLTVGRPRASSG